MPGTLTQRTPTTERPNLVSGEIPALALLVGTGDDLVLDITSGFDQVLGRDGSADITLRHPTISRRHARVTYEPDGVWLEDLGSTNGSYVNGHRVVDRCRLRDGDEIGIGSTKAVFHDVIVATPDPTGRHDRLSGEPGAPCPRCSAALTTGRRFCPQCGYQQSPISLPQAVPTGADAEITRRRLMGPHGNARPRPFREVMRARNGGRRPFYNEGLAVPGLLVRLLLVMTLVAAVVAALVVLGLGVDHFVQLRQQPVGQPFAGHSHSVLPIKFHNRMR